MKFSEHFGIESNESDEWFSCFAKDEYGAVAGMILFLPFVPQPMVRYSWQQ